MTSRLRAGLLALCLLAPGFAPASPATPNAAAHLLAARLSDGGLEAVGELPGVHRVAPSFPGVDDEILASWHWVETETDPAHLERALSGTPGVIEVERPPARTPAYTTSDPLRTWQWHLEAAGLYGAWDRERGDGAVVGIVDSGFDARHPDLDLRDLRGRPGVTTVTEGCSPRLPYADHGTLVAGIAGARTDNRIGVAGAGFRSRVLAVAAGLPMNGACLVSGRWPEAIPPLVDAGVDVINLSFVGSTRGAVEQDAIRYAMANGVLVVASAGNAGETRPGYPAAYPEVVGTSAVGSDGRLWSSSNRGPWVDVAAPGVALGTTCAGGYCRGSGTSFASALVTGTAAIVSAAGHASPFSLRSRLLGDGPDGPAGVRLDAVGAASRTSIRLAGRDRYETAAAVVREANPGRVSRVVLASGSSDGDWAYALPATALLGDGDTALLLSGRDHLPAATAGELDRLLADDGEILVVGDTRHGPSEAAVGGLRTRYTVRRIGAGDPIQTAIAVAREVASRREPRAVLIARSDLFADALSLSAVAARDGVPLLLVPPGGVPGNVCDWLGSQGKLERIEIAGGEGAIPAPMASRLRECAAPIPLFRSIEVVRHAGRDRIETALAVADAHFPSRSAVSLASGWRWPDAVVGGALARRLGAPVLLTPGDHLRADVRSRIDAPAALLGGRAALGHAVAAGLPR